MRWWRGRLNVEDIPKNKKKQDAKAWYLMINLLNFMFIHVKIRYIIKRNYFQLLEKITSILSPCNAFITLMELLTGFTQNFFVWYTILTGQILLYSGRKNTNDLFFIIFWKRVKLYKYENTFSTNYTPYK